MDFTEKQAAYNKLVKLVQKDYEGREEKISTTNAKYHIHKCEYVGKHINLWSYWQGNLDARILVVGQDWGSFHPRCEKRVLDRIMEKNFKRMDAGEDCKYFDGTEKVSISGTDKNLMELFRVLGEPYTDLRSMEAPLFFTNLCLGYRNEGYTGGFRRKWITDDLKYLIGYTDETGNRVMGLLEIILPKVVLCLGKEVYQTVGVAMIGKEFPQTNFYEALSKKCNFFETEISGSKVRIYGLAHPGGQGRANRKARAQTNEKHKTGEELQKEDWLNVRGFLETL